MQIKKKNNFINYIKNTKIIGILMNHLTIRKLRELIYNHR